MGRIRDTVNLLHRRRGRYSPFAMGLLSSFDISGSLIMNSSLMPDYIQANVDLPRQGQAYIIDDRLDDFLLLARRGAAEESAAEEAATNEPVDPAILISLYSRLQQPSLSKSLLQRGIPDLTWEVIEALGRLGDGAKRLGAILEPYHFPEILELQDTSEQLRIAEKLLLRLSELPPSEEGHWGEAQQAVQLTKQLVLTFDDQLGLGISAIASYAHETRNPSIVAEVSKWTARMLSLSDALNRPHIWDAVYNELLEKAAS